MIDDCVDVEDVVDAPTPPESSSMPRCPVAVSSEDEEPLRAAQGRRSGDLRRGRGPNVRGAADVRRLSRRHRPPSRWGLQCLRSWSGPPPRESDTESEASLNFRDRTLSRSRSPRWGLHHAQPTRFGTCRAGSTLASRGSSSDLEDGDGAPRVGVAAAASSSSSSGPAPDAHRTWHRDLLGGDPLREAAAGVPPILEVPLPADAPSTAEPRDARSVSPFSLPSWLSALGPSREPAPASFYVEHVRHGMEPQYCRACNEAFAIGQLRLGYTPCGLAPDGRPCPPIWIHALRCTRTARLVLRQSAEQAGFSPAVSLASRRQILEELRQLPTVLPPVPARAAGTAPRLCIRPWRYLPAVLQQWVVLPVPNAIVPPPPPPTPTPFPPLARSLQAPAFMEGEFNAPQVREVLAQLLAEVTRPLPMAAEVYGLLASVPVEEVTVRRKEPCVICREPMLPRQTCRRLPCLHLFHQSCIDQWLHVKPTCPLDNLKLSDMLCAQQSIWSSASDPL